MVPSESDDFHLATLAQGPASIPDRTRSVSPQGTHTTGGSPGVENMANPQLVNGTEVLPANDGSVSDARVVATPLAAVASLPEAAADHFDGLLHTSSAPPSPGKRITRAQSASTLAPEAGSTGGAVKKQARKASSKPMDVGGRDLTSMTTESYAKNLPALVDNLMRIYDRIEEVRADAQADNSRLNDSLRRALQSIEGLDAKLSSQITAKIASTVTNTLDSRAAPTLGEPHLRALQNAHNTLVATMESRLTELDSTTQALRAEVEGLTTKVEALSIAHAGTDGEVAYLRDRVYEDGYYSSLAHLQPPPPVLPPPPPPTAPTGTPVAPATPAAVSRPIFGNNSQTVTSMQRPMFGNNSRTFGMPPPQKCPRYENPSRSSTVPSGGGGPSTSAGANGYSTSGPKYVRFGPYPWKLDEDIKGQFFRCTAAVRETVRIGQRAVVNVSLERDVHFVSVTFKNAGEASKFVSAWVPDGSLDGTAASLVSM
ncbi:hypothetical protein FOMPIDRAFT_1055825 [Fomitopsis schrenkii]|uniref:Uncharacterized protein n=1 Tax=Fomitopsis schrenkii TaxID=2126942 RepID=S8DQT0_FOMSC|nr:hypothetical protein FOMPIDRAFT_1055825 [Fomitopsis schrenkii]